MLFLGLKVPLKTNKEAPPLSRRLLCYHLRVRRHLPRCTHSTIVWAIIRTINRRLSVGDRGMHCTFQAVIGGEKLTMATRNLMHPFGNRNAVPNR